MRRTVVAATVVMLALSGAVASIAAPVRPPAGPATVDAPVQHVACQGNIRTYRNFEHCMKVNGTRSIRYYSRICR